MHFNLIVCSRGATETFASDTENNWLVFAALEFARVLVSDLLCEHISVRIGAAINVADIADAARPEPSKVCVKTCMVWSPPCPKRQWP